MAFPHRLTLAYSPDDGLPVASTSRVLWTGESREEVLANIARQLGELLADFVDLNGL